MRDDRRTAEERKATAGFVVATDSFMSGWGKARGRSLFAVPFSHEQAKEGLHERIADNMRDRSEMQRVRIVGADYRPRLYNGDHLSIRGIANGRWLERGGFRK